MAPVRWLSLTIPYSYNFVDWTLRKTFFVQTRYIFGFKVVLAQCGWVLGA